MSIETIGIRTIITTDPRPRDYVNKNLAVAKARRDYFSESHVIFLYWSLLNNNSLCTYGG